MSANLQNLRLFLSSLSLGPSQKVGQVTLVPLLQKGASADADLLEEALAQEKVTVSEISQGGSVNQIKVLHQGERILLLLDGEQVVGAKQNRIFNASYLVGPKSEVTVPVSCVERGRWSYKSEKFGSSPTTLTNSARTSKLSRVTQSLKSGSYDAQQSKVWEDVDALSQKLGTYSGTSAFAEIAQERVSKAEAELSLIRVLEDQVGLATVHQDKLVGLDLFGSPGLFARAWKKIGRGILAEVYEGQEGTQTPEEVVRRALSFAQEMPLNANKAPGVGETLSGNEEGFSLQAITFEDRLYHALGSEVSENKATPPPQRSLRDLQAPQQIQQRIPIPPDLEE